MKAVAAVVLVIAACQPPPPAQAPYPPQPVYVGEQEPAAVQEPAPADPYASDYRQPSGSQAEIAARLDAEGEAAFAQRQYELASSRFRNAVSRVPEAKYFFHLCQSLFYEGKFSEALTACNAADLNNPTADLKRKNDALTKRILDEARAQGISVAPAPRPGPYQPAGADGGGRQAQLAARLDDDGERLVKAGRFADASSKFREAVARVPEARYFLHLCNSLFQEGKFSDALTSCNAVGKNEPTPDVQRKADALTQRIKDEARKQGLNVGAP